MTPSERDYSEKMLNYWSDRCNVWQMRLNMSTCPLQKKKFKRALDDCNEQRDKYRATLEPRDA